MPRKPTLAENMGLPAVAGAMAVCFTHPLELTKTRLQLDNERAAKGQKKLYSGWTNCVKQNYATDGVKGLQRGLQLGIVRELCFNAVRIGLVPVVTDMISGDRKPTGLERFAGGMTCGALGGCCVNPIEVLKIRMQSQGGLTGFQHTYPSTTQALASLVKDEGFAGMTRGILTSTVRGCIGPGSQVVAYGEMKAALVERGWSGGSILTHVPCALASAAISIAVVNPVDVVRTRVYNAPVRT